MATQEEAETMRTQIAQLIEQNEALQASVETIQQQQIQEKAGSHHGEPIKPEPQPLSAEIWSAPIPDNFKPPHLSTFSDAALRWYIKLPRFSIISYHDMIRKLSQQFSASRHRKVSSNSLFNVC